MKKILGVQQPEEVNKTTHKQYKRALKHPPSRRTRESVTRRRIFSSRGKGKAVARSRSKMPWRIMEVKKVLLAGGSLKNRTTAGTNRQRLKTGYDPYYAALEVNGKMKGK